MLVPGHSPHTGRSSQHHFLVLGEGAPPSLLRFDAYYILSDWAELPNLWTNSRRYIRYLGKRYLLDGLFRGGVYGFAFSMMSGFGRWMRDVKMYERVMRGRAR